MALFASLAVMAATRLGFKIAEKKKWLPSSVYYQLAMDKLRSGNLQDALKLNEIALQKRPDSEKALIIKDVLAMRRDAMLSDLTTQIERTKKSIQDIEKEKSLASRQLARLQGVQRLLKFLPWLVLFVNIFLYLLSYYFLTIRQNPIAGSLQGGFAIVCSILVYIFFQFARDRHIQNSLKQTELLSAQSSLQRELAIQQKNLRTVQSKLSETRYQLLVK